jgi:hypothetical protein
MNRIANNMRLVGSKVLNRVAFRNCFFVSAHLPDHYSNVAPYTHIYTRHDVGTVFDDSSDRFPTLVCLYNCFYFAASTRSADLSSPTYCFQDAESTKGIWIGAPILGLAITHTLASLCDTKYFPRTTCTDFATVKMWPGILAFLNSIGNIVSAVGWRVKATM